MSRSGWRTSRSGWQLGLGVGLAWVGLGSLTPDARAQPVPAAGARVQEDVLAPGNALLQKKDYPGATRAFAAVVAANPSDARALSELSWAAFLAGDYATARSAGERSLVLAQTPALKAASYYNLGRVKEANGDRAGASAAYEASLKLRESKEVRRRLGLLGGDTAVPGAPKVEEPFVGHKLLGPYGQPEEFCGKQPREPEFCSVQPPQLPTGGGTIKPEAPFLDLQIIRSAHPGSDDQNFHFAVRLASGWYVLADLFDAPKHSYVLVPEARLTGGRLLVRYIYEEGRFDSTTDSGVILCGLGAEPRPSCFGPIATVRATNVHQGGKENGADTTTVEFNCRAELAPGDLWQVQDGPKQPFLINADKIILARPGSCAKQPFFAKRKLTF